MTRTTLASFLVAAGLGLPALAGFTDNAYEFRSDWPAFPAPLAGEGPKVLSFTGNWWWAAVTVNELGAFQQPDSWRLSFNFTHVRGPHGEPLNAVDHPDLWIKKFNADGSLNIGTVMRLGSSEPHIAHWDTWTFVVDLSPGSGMKVNLTVDHNDTPAPSTLLAVLGIVGCAGRRRR